MTATAELACVAAGPLVTFQDAGRPGQLRYGVPGSGPMDRLAYATANVAVGNVGPATVIEVSRGGVRLECRAGSVTVSVAGGGFSVMVGRRSADPWTVVTLAAGDVLSVQPGDWGSWSYVAFAGEVDVQRWLGSASTHSISGQGGGALGVGQRFAVASARSRPDLDGEIPLPELARPSSVVPVVMGPQLGRFVDDAADTFLGATFALSDDYNRMGARLDGPGLMLRDALAIPSEPIVRGSIQVSGDGVPTVLLADHQTTGGYPKIATVLESALDQFVQHRPGDQIRFEEVTPGEGLALARERDRRVRDVLQTVSRPGRTLAQRLMLHNLIGWGDQVDD